MNCQRHGSMVGDAKCPFCPEPGRYRRLASEQHQTLQPTNLSQTSSSKLTPEREEEIRQHCKLLNTPIAAIMIIDLLAEIDELRAEYRQLADIHQTGMMERDRYRKELETIAATDFRGNHSVEQQIAHHALVTKE